MKRCECRGRPVRMAWIALVLALFVVMAGKAHAVGTAGGTAINNQASISYEDSGGNNYSANSNTVTTTVNNVYTVAVNTPANQNGNSNGVVYYAYTVTNSGNASNTFALSAASGAGGNNWVVALYADDGAGGGVANDGIHQAGETTVTASTGALAADATYKFFVAVTVTANTANGQTDDSVLTVTGSGDAGAGDDTSDTVTTTAQAPALTVTKAVRNVTTAGAFAGTANADPGQTLEYRLAVANGGAVDATSVVLTDNDHANTTFVAGSIWIGPDGTANNGGTNVNVDDNNIGAETCATNTCGQGSVDGSGNVTANLGNGSTEGAGGSIPTATTVYVYFRVTVD